MSTNAAKDPWTFRIGDAPKEIGMSQATVRRRAKAPNARLKLKLDGNCTFVVIDDKAEYFNSLPDAGANQTDSQR